MTDPDSRPQKACDCDYLPYRLHATSDQFNRAFPMAGEFFALKANTIRPGVFENRFSMKYGR